MARQLQRPGQGCTGEGQAQEGSMTTSTQVYGHFRGYNGLLMPICSVSQHDPDLDRTQAWAKSAWRDKAVAAYLDFQRRIVAIEA